MSKTKGEVHEIRLEPMGKKTGVISHTVTQFKRSGQGGGPDHDYETEKMHHPTMEHLHAHMAEKLEPHFGSTADGEKEPDKGED